MRTRGVGRRQGQRRCRSGRRPNTGVAVYDTTRYNGALGWQVYGGTSVASPITASVYALGGNLTGYPAAYT